MMYRLKAAALAAAIWMLPAAALAQTSPNWPFGYVPTAAEWSAVFAAKMDYAGSPAITAAGGSLTGKLTFANSTTGTAGANCGVGAAPSSPVNGDIWCTTAGMFVQIAGSTVGPLGPGISSTVTVPQGGTGVTTITSGNVLIGQGASAITSYARAGTATTIATASGTLTNGHCVSINATADFVDAGGTCTTGGASGVVAAATIGQLAIYTTNTTTVAGLTGCNSGYFGTNGGGTVSCQTSLLAALQASITQVGTIATGVWNGTAIAGQYGGTGVANTGLTITLAGNLVTAGANSLTLTTIGATNVTLPTTGTLMNQNGTSGGIPYYNSATTTQSSAALTLNAPVIGGGAGASPSVGSTTDTRAAASKSTLYATAEGATTSTHCAQWNANGNVADSGATCAGATGGAVLLTTLTVGAGTCSPTTTCTDVGASGCAAAGCFTNAYPSYTVRLLNLVATTPGTAVICQLQVYQSATFQNAGYVNSAGSTAYIPCGIASGTSFAAPGVVGTMTVYNPSVAAKAMWAGTTGSVTTGGTGIGMLNVGGWWNTNGAVTGFRIFFGTTAGTPTTNGIASGIIEVYGNP